VFGEEIAALDKN